MCTRKSVCGCMGGYACVCVWFGRGLSLDQNLAWYMLPTTAVMKEVGPIRL